MMLCIKKKKKLETKIQFFIPVFTMLGFNRIRYITSYILVKMHSLKSQIVKKYEKVMNWKTDIWKTTSFIKPKQIVCLKYKYDFGSGTSYQRANQMSCKCSKRDLLISRITFQNNNSCFFSYTESVFVYKLLFLIKIAKLIILIRSQYIDPIKMNHFKSHKNR